MQSSTTKVFVVNRIGGRLHDTEVIMAFTNREDAEKFATEIHAPGTYCLADEKPKPGQYMWSDRFRVTEVSLY